MSFVGSSYPLAVAKIAIERAVNMFVAKTDNGPILRSVPGYVLFSNGGAVTRGCIATDDQAFIVHGDGLYEITSVGALILRGTLLTTSGAVEMARGLTQIVIVDGENGYVLSLASNVLTQITADGFYGSKTVAYVDGYFIFIRPDTRQFYISAIDDALSLDALDFASAESNPSRLVAAAVAQRRLVLLKEDSSEIWSDSGGADFPFEREGTTIEIGCRAPHSVRVVDNSIFMVGRDKNGGGNVYRMEGYSWHLISEPGVDEALQSSTDLSEATAYAYQENGLTFYCINAPGLTSTWCYEVASGKWHERCDLDELGEFKADRGVCHMYAFNQHLIGGNDGKVYRLDASVFTKAGDPLVRERTSPHQATKSGNRQFFDAFRLDCTTGETAQGNDPFVTLAWTGDSGAIFGNPVAKSLGRVGDRYNRITWRRLGGGTDKSRDRNWRVRCSDDCDFNIIDANIVSHEATA